MHLFINSIKLILNESVQAVQGSHQSPLNHGSGRKQTNMGITNMRKPEKFICVLIHHGGEGESNMDSHWPFGKGFCTHDKYKVSVNLDLLSASKVIFSYRGDSLASPIFYTYEHLSLVVLQVSSSFCTVLYVVACVSLCGRLGDSTVNLGISKLLSQALKLPAIWSEPLSLDLKQG